MNGKLANDEECHSFKFSAAIVTYIFLFLKKTWKIFFDSKNETEGNKSN